MKLVAAGHDVEFLVPSNRPGTKTPDVRIDGTAWEMKAPIGTGRHTISHQISRAAKQCPNVVIDTARTSLQDDWIVAEIRRRFDRSPRLTAVWIISKTGALVRMAR